MERVFDICHGCRRCFNLCDSFPRLFDLIDNGPTGEVDGVKKEDYAQVEEAALIPADYEKFGDRLPAALWAQHEALLHRLAAAAKTLVAAE